PHAEFPYEQLVEENRRRSRHDPEFELIDTGVFDEDRYWDITAEYAKAGPDDICIRLTARNAGPEAETVDVLPTLWFRNTWSWGPDEHRPSLSASDGGVETKGYRFGRMRLRGQGSPELLFSQNESNAERLWSVAG